MEHTYLTGDVPTRQEFLDLARKAEQLRVAHEATGLVTWAWEIGSDHLEWHGDISTFLGMPPESFKGRFRDYLGMLHVEDAGPARDAFVDCLKGRRSHYRREERIIQPDGSVRWLEAHGRGFYGSAGGAVRMVGVFSDVSYRKAQEEALAVSEERFFKAYHATPDGIALSRVQDGMIVEVNAAFSRITGLSAGELLGKTSTSLGLWGDGDKRTEAMRPLVETGRIRDLVGSLITRAGDRRTVVFNAERILVGDVPYLMSVTRDITDQYLAERALAKSERRYRSLFDSALDVIVILSAKGEIIDANRAACLASGYELAVLTGRSIKDLVDPHDRGGKVNLNDVFTHGFLRAELHMLRRDGVSVPVEAHAWPLPDGNIQLSVRDVTDRKHSEALVHDLNVTLERRVAERTAELVAANRELESFSHTISHDLRAPIRAIGGFTEALRRTNGPVLNADGVRYLGLVEKNALRMDVMINDLLKFARAGLATVGKAPVDMQGLARSVIDELATGAFANVQIEVAPLPAVMGDASLLRQVWVNLVANALKFSAKASHPRIVVGVEPSIEAGGEPRPAQVVFSVRDNGCGFEPEYAEKLFGVFQRLHSSTEYEGNGVGLAIVQRIVARHGGRVSALSAPGEGATFRFSLPVY